MTHHDRPSGSCPTSIGLSENERTSFGTRGCAVYGYPSTGGVLSKEADILDMLFLSISRTERSQRSTNVEEEDKFCNLLRRTGAKWWPSIHYEAEVSIGMRLITEEEAKIFVLGWPADGVGVWVLRFKNEMALPMDFGRLTMALDMEEKIGMMKEYGAEFVEDIEQVEELSWKRRESTS
ncbi:hypothetical protein VTL71DRAFT_9789 [Oculimacula yallundae]|uniref:Uncharacterized protein n=1 Tax=Oculimacula yallundae TaxID=86028 RepID=A0ABR4BTL9_9HELO